MKKLIKFLLVALTLITLAKESRGQVTDEFSLAFTDTTSIAGDTTSRRVISASNTLADTCQRYQMLITTDADIYFSSSASFPANNTFTISARSDGFGGLIDWEWFTSFIPNWYYKAVTGTATVDIKIKCKGKQ